MIDASNGMRLLELGQPVGDCRHDRILNVGEGEPQETLLTRAEHGARQAKQILIHRETLGDPGRAFSLERMLQIGEVGAHADHGPAGILAGEGIRETRHPAVDQIALIAAPAVQVS